MGLFAANAVLFLAVLVIDFASVATDSLREQIISEIKGYFDKEIAELKRKHDNEIAALDAKLTKSLLEIADLRMENERLSNGLRKVLHVFTLDHPCQNLWLSFRGQNTHVFGGKKKTKTKPQGYNNTEESKGLLDKGNVIKTARNDSKDSPVHSGRVQGYNNTEESKGLLDKGNVIKTARNDSKDSPVHSGRVPTLAIKTHVRDKKRQVNSLLPAGSGVAFFAVMSNLSYNTTANQDLKFDKVITNIGGAFNTNSSLFVATIPGVYVFSFSVLARGQHAHVKLVKNGHVVARANLNDWEQSTQLVVLQLKKGDGVAIRNDDITAIDFHGELYPTFAGFLLYDYSDSPGAIVGK